MCGLQTAASAAAVITSVSFERGFDTLAIQGTGLPLTGVDFSKIVITGDGGAYTLGAGTALYGAPTTTYVSIGIEGSDRSYVRWAWNRAGTSGLEGTPYSITLLAGWAPGEAPVTKPVVVTDFCCRAPLAYSHFYDPVTGVLKGNGNGAYMVHKPGNNNDVTANKVTFVGEGGRRYTLTSSLDADFTFPNGGTSSAVEWSISLSAVDKEQVNMMMNKRDAQSTGGTTYAIELASGWNTVLSENLSTYLGVYPAPPKPTITSADYDAATGTLVVTGSNFVQLGGANNDVTASKFRISGQGGASYTLTDTSNVDIASGTRFTLTMSATDKAALIAVLSKNGTSSADNRAYNLEALDHWAAGADGAVNVADLTGNPITVSNFSTAPTPTPTPQPDGSIPPLVVSAPRCGVQALPDLIDISLGAGPAAGAELSNTLSTVLGLRLQPPVSHACGSVVLAGAQPGSGSWSLYVESFRKNDIRSNGAYALGDGRYEVVSNGQVLVLAQATVHIEQLMASLPGVQASVAATGVITAVYNGQTYVVQPGTGVQVDAAGAPRIVADANGRYHFIDNTGNNQTLYPAFANLTALRTALQGMDPAFSMGLQLDGTVSATLRGKAYTLVPDYTLDRVPTDRVGQSSWQENASRFRYVTTPGLTQGVSIQ